MYLPEEAHWLANYLHEIAIFDNGKYDDQVDSKSQALDWFPGKNRQHYGVLEYAKSISSVAIGESQKTPLFMRQSGARF